MKFRTIYPTNAIINLLAKSDPGSHFKPYFWQRDSEKFWETQRENYASKWPAVAHRHNLGEMKRFNSWKDAKILKINQLKRSFL